MNRRICSRESLLPFLIAPSDRRSTLESRRFFHQEIRSVTEVSVTLHHWYKTTFYFTYGLLIAQSAQTFKNRQKSLRFQPILLTAPWLIFRKMFLRFDLGGLFMFCCAIHICVAMIERNGLRPARYWRQSRHATIVPCHEIGLSAFSTVAADPRPGCQWKARRRPETERCCR